MRVYSHIVFAHIGVIAILLSCNNDLKVEPCLTIIARGNKYYVNDKLMLDSQKYTTFVNGIYTVASYSDSCGKTPPPIRIKCGKIDTVCRMMDIKW